MDWPYTLILGCILRPLGIQSDRYGTVWRIVASLTFVLWWRLGQALSKQYRCNVGEQFESNHLSTQHIWKRIEWYKNEISPNRSKRNPNSLATAQTTSRSTTSLPTQTLLSRSESSMARCHSASANTSTWNHSARRYDGKYAIAYRLPLESTQWSRTGLVPWYYQYRRRYTLAHCRITSML